MYVLLPLRWFKVVTKDRLMMESFIILTQSSAVHIHALNKIRDEFQKL